MEQISRKNRERVLIETIEQRGKLDTHEAAALLDVSECTVRRIFGNIEADGKAIRYHGGIRTLNNGRQDYHFKNSQLLQENEKRLIGEYASKLVENGDVIFLDAGTTIQQMAIALANRLRNKELSEISVFTNSLRNLTILNEYCEVTLIGGLFRKRRQDFCGHLSEIVLESISFGKCFLGADGVSLDPKDGIMATDTYTARINEIISSRANRFYLLTDSTKFRRRSFIRYALVEEAKAVITDKNISDRLYQELTALGIEVVRL